MAEVNIPDKAMDAADRVYGIGSDEEYERLRATLAAAAPLIVAADYEQFAAKLRSDLQRLREYAHGSLAWRVMNEIDTHIVELRGGAT